MRVPAAALILPLVLGCSSDEQQGPVAWDGEPPPSILLVSIDTLRADHLGLYGYERDTSPYLDRLADECLVFDRAYTTAPWTLIAHMSMLTGLEAEEHGVNAPTRALSPEVVPVAERLHDAGYRTLGFHADNCIWVEPRFGFGRGFDLYEPHAGPADAEERIANELDLLAANRPVFLFLHLFDVHTARFKDGFEGFYDPPAPHDTAFLPGARERLAGIDCQEVWDGLGTLPPEEIEALIALYDGGIRYVDSELERIIEGWRERGLLDRSLLIITADHGEGLGDHGRVSGHGGMYEEGLRIPLLVRFPDGYRAGEREGGLVSVTDYAPTILAEGGLDVEPWRAGGSLRAPREERVVRATRALISERWKSVSQGGGSHVYDLDRDAEELKPRDEDHPTAHEHARELRRRYQTERAARAPVPGEAIDLEALDESQLESLRDLGYAGVVDG